MPLSSGGVGPAKWRHSPLPSSDASRHGWWRRKARPRRRQGADSCWPCDSRQKRKGPYYRYVAAPPIAMIAWQFTYPQPWLSRRNKAPRTRSRPRGLVRPTFGLLNTKYGGHSLGRVRMLLFITERRLVVLTPAWTCLGCCTGRGMVVERWQEASGRARWRILRAECGSSQVVPIASLLLPREAKRALLRSEILC